jgi:hypothetical protein
MPTPAVTGQAVLQPINLTAPGFLGLNTDKAAAILNPAWATLANNAVFDDVGRLATRNGFQTQTTTAVAGTVMRVHEYIKADGTAEVIFSTDADIFSGVTAPSSIEGSLAISEGNIKFVNFNDKCIALGTGTSSNPSVYTGSGSFTTVTVATGTAPTSGIGTAAMGRLWVVDADGKTIRYSAIIDETKWATADGGGTIDMSKVWVAGQDEVVAIEEFAGDLVVFGKNQIVIWTDGAASELGINPTDLYVSDTITGMGAVSQFAIERVEGDLWFLTPNGVESLIRARTDRTTPTFSVTENIQDELKGFLFNETDEDDITMVYSPEHAICILNFPGSNRQIVLSSKVSQNPENGQPVYPITTWTSEVQTLAYKTSDRTLVGSFTTVAGEILKYIGLQDNGASYSFSYESGWMDLGEQSAQFMKWVKKLTSIVLVSASTTLTYTLKYDFESTGRDIQHTVAGQGGAEFSISEFTDSAAGIGYKDPAAGTLVESEFGGGITLRTIPVPGAGGGQYIKVGITLDNASGQFALQHINLFAKLGRIANV